MTPKLSICIPTRNRCEYLRDLLGCIRKQITPEIEVIVSDNASTDPTKLVVQCSGLHDIRYHRNNTNIGAVANLRQVLDMARGEWVWPIGDDDLLLDGAIRSVMRNMVDDVGLIVVYDMLYDGAIPQEYRQSLRHMLSYACAICPHAILERTLMSSNVFRRTPIDSDKDLFGTPFEHMARADSAGLIGVYVMSERPISTRERRPPCVDGEWPDLERGWHQYLTWLKRWHADIDVERILDTVPKRKLAELRKHPIRFLSRNLRSIASPSGIKWAAGRISSFLKNKKHA